MLGSHSISRKLMTVMLITSGTVLLLMTAAIFSY